MVVSWEQVPNEVQEDCHRALTDFLSSPTTSNDTIESSLKFLRAEMPLRQPTIPPRDDSSLSDIVDRLRLAQRFQEGMSRTTSGYQPLNLMHLSLFIFGDRVRLEYLAEHYSGAPNDLLRWHLQSVEPFLLFDGQREKHIVADPEAPKEADDETDESNEPHDKDPASHPERRHFDWKSERNEKESNEALMRDGGKCVVTDSIYPDVCHIWPFTLNNSTDRLKSARDILCSVMPLLSGDLYPRFKILFFPDNGEIASSDKSWNMILMNAQLHRYWSKAFFGLKLVESQAENSHDDGFAVIQVEWRWLSQKIPEALEKSLGPLHPKKKHAGREVRMTPEMWDEMAKSLHEHIYSPLVSALSGTAHHAFSSRPIESGHIFTLKVKREDADKTRTLIKMQWIAIQMAALCGAAEVVDELERRPPPPPIFPRVPGVVYDV